MTNERMQEVIATVLGWIEFVNIGGTLYGIRPNGLRYEGTRIVPDYPNDLNACAEFEAELTGYEAKFYGATLVSPRGYVWETTAAQRCEAFLRTKLLWES